MRDSSVDIRTQFYRDNKGEFHLNTQEAFEKHIKRLHKYVQIAKREFPCLKGREFIDYVLSRENYWYKPWWSTKEVK